MESVLSKFEELFIRRDLFMPIELIIFLLILIVIIPVWLYKRKRKSDGPEKDNGTD